MAPLARHHAGVRRGVDHGFDPQVIDALGESRAAWSLRPSRLAGRHRDQEAARISPARAAGVARLHQSSACCSWRQPADRASRLCARSRTFPGRRGAHCSSRRSSRASCAHTGYFYLIQRYPLTSVAPLTTLSPVFTILFGVALLGRSSLHANRHRRAFYSRRRVHHHACASGGSWTPALERAGAPEHARPRRCSAARSVPVDTAGTDARPRRRRDGRSAREAALRDGGIAAGRESLRGVSERSAGALECRSVSSGPTLRTGASVSA